MRFHRLNQISKPNVLIRHVVRDVLDNLPPEPPKKVHIFDPSLKPLLEESYQHMLELDKVYKTERKRVPVEPPPAFLPLYPGPFDLADDKSDVTSQKKVIAAIPSDEVTSTKKKVKSRKPVFIHDESELFS